MQLATRFYRKTVSGARVFVATGPVARARVLEGLKPLGWVNPNPNPDRKANGDFTSTYYSSLIRREKVV
jgi:hypothetical protein